MEQFNLCCFLLSGDITRSNLMLTGCAPVDKLCLSVYTTSYKLCLTWRFKGKCYVASEAVGMGIGKDE